MEMEEMETRRREGITLLAFLSLSLCFSRVSLEGVFFSFGAKAECLFPASFTESRG